MKNLGKPIQVAMRTTSVMGLLDTVATTDLVAPCFAPVAKSYHGNLKQVHIPDVEDIGSMELFIFIHRKNLESAKYKWFISLIEDAFERLSQSE
ncbi:transcriptional regulator [Vibrio ishigakensis]|uniref:Transcriptional regulator n=3 Tax=Vibrio ishigakensis TaxID=1481914 RepID=A0A0B8NP41_9VIBR|nr:transcriptional regulator [Vibrio ishigakensis]